MQRNKILINESRMPFSTAVTFENLEATFIQNRSLLKQVLCGRSMLNKPVSLYSILTSCDYKGQSFWGFRTIFVTVNQCAQELFLTVYESDSDRKIPNLTDYEMQSSHSITIPFTACMVSYLSWFFGH